MAISSPKNLVPGKYYIASHMAVNKQKVRLSGERELLRRIYSRIEDTGWQQRIDRWLKELRF
jgi:hypothetical protein